MLSSESGQEIQELCFYNAQTLNESPSLSTLCPNGLVSSCDFTVFLACCTRSFLVRVGNFAAVEQSNMDWSGALGLNKPVVDVYQGFYMSKLMSFFDGSSVTSLHKCPHC